MRAILASFCLTRRPEALRGRVGSTTEAVAGDVLEPASLEAACKASTRRTTLCTPWAPSATLRTRTGGPRRTCSGRSRGIRRIFYLGGLGNPDETLSKHLAAARKRAIY